MTNLQFFLSNTLGVVASTDKCTVYLYDMSVCPSQRDPFYRFRLSVTNGSRDLYEFEFIVSPRKIVVDKHSYAYPCDFRFYPDELNRIAPFVNFSYTNYETFLKRIEFALDILSDYNPDLFN